jgi:hypothetical protein
MGGVIKSLSSKKGKRQAAQLSRFPRSYITTSTQTVLRNRRIPKPEFGVNELELRAAPKAGSLDLATLPERIVHKKLSSMLHGTHNFIFQREELGGRNYIGGFILDFTIIDRQPYLAIEILGDYWHQAYQKASDLEREMGVLREGYLYHEIWESDIYISDENLENKLNVILEGRI